jgi:hypothetical protein
MKKLLLLLLLIPNLVMGESKNLQIEPFWNQKSGNGYRFTEQYGIQDVRRGDKQFVKRKNDEGRQYVARIDFTFSKKHGWKMYYTAALIPETDTKIILTIDEKEFVFYGNGILNKQELTINNEIIKHLKSTKNDFYIQENYPNSDIQYSTAYRTIFKSKGLRNSLQWVGKSNLVMALPPCPEGDNEFWNECKGTMNFPSGATYVGEYKNNQANGQGTYTYEDGEKYVGQWKDGQLNGQAIARYANGNKYVGQWKNHKLHGQGTYTFANGSKYVGEYKDQKRHGQGTFISPDGKKLSGEWKDGEFVDEKISKPKEALKTTVSATNFQLPPINILKTTIEQIIWDDGQIKLPVEGGWGYSKDDALVINKNHANVDQSKQFNGVRIEKKYVRYRAWKELKLNENHYFSANEIKYNQKNQALIRGEGDKLYDLLKYEICAEELFLNNKGEPNIKSDILLCYDTEYWFEISSFFGK